MVVPRSPASPVRPTGMDDQELGPAGPPPRLEAELPALVQDPERFVTKHYRLQHQLRAARETSCPAAMTLSGEVALGPSSSSGTMSTGDC